VILEKPGLERKVICNIKLREKARRITNER
jgi:hypothetical protein